MFAFALWDEPRRELLLARDRFGKKPLYYAEIGPSLMFGSELKSLLAAPELPDAGWTREPVAVSGARVRPHPVFDLRGCPKLPAATCCRWREGRTSDRAYWNLSFRPDPSRAVDADEYAEELAPVCVRRSGAA